ncbi:histidine--tRNA ligase [Plasmodium gonderi]|uniref:histidine--tRNA ligase n=1 Tax=Plasmodium gonderi TaxID=77519 RepID=A0A1Y1JGE3_PLAGO|nr:histidine--tRNA ligase [Plasmodium gonderi]GAW80405.1 histidine--tRNA ligase [Plasmodium gonderi]
MLISLSLILVTLVEIHSFRTRIDKESNFSYHLFFQTNSFANKSRLHTYNSTFLKKNKEKKQICLKGVKGIRTFNPYNYAKREYLFKIWKEISESFSYSLYDLPVLEDYEMFRKSKINESYDFVKNNRHLILRPEITPQLVNHLFIRKKRVSVKKAKQQNSKNGSSCQHGRKKEQKDLHSSTSHPCVNLKSERNVYLLHNLRQIHKMSTIGQCFRYEKTSSCRKREHYQWNMDIIGTNSIEAEIEMLTILIAFFRKVNLGHSDVVIKINDKRIVDFVIRKVFKISLDQFSPSYIQHNVVKNIMHILDKYKKISSGTFKLLLKKNIPNLDMYEIKHFYNVIQKINTLPDLEIFFNSKKKSIYYDLHTLVTYFEKINLSNFFQIDLTIVRGLDYYTNIIFESFYKHKNYRAICGGGRYNFFLNQGGPKVCAVGFGMGDVVITEILFNNHSNNKHSNKDRQENLAANLCKNIDVVSFFPHMTNQQALQSHIQMEYFSIVDVLRRNGLRVYSLLTSSNSSSISSIRSIRSIRSMNLSKALKKANSLDAHFFLFFDEHASAFSLKDLKTGEQKIVTPADVLSVYGRA